VHEALERVDLGQPLEQRLLLVGRELNEMNDRDYGAWTEEAYAEALWDKELRIEAARALIRTSFGPTLKTRYDRVLFPWRRGADDYIIGVSRRRETPRPVPPDTALDAA